MLKLININQIYKYGKQSSHILKDINLKFKSHELVFILGPSGSGKSTLLNILGGLLKPTSGEVYFSNMCLNKISSNDLAKYRNCHFGYIFQNYHLIEHMTVLDNLKLCQNKPNINRIDLILKQLNIYHHRSTKVSLLSGGEKERIAIARALLNNPQVVFCDEPTGALDYKNSINVMEILKGISKSKLVIVVSHDISLANNYADRIINIKDGQVTTNQINEDLPNIKLTKTKINKFTILKLALKNLFLSFYRTCLTALATSIGITTISLITFLNTGFNQEIKNLEENLVTKFPITIEENNYELLPPKQPILNNTISIKKQSDHYHTNKITNSYLSYVNNNPNYHSILYHYDINIPLITDNYKNISVSETKVFSSTNYINENYQLLAGKLPESQNEILIQIDSYHQISEKLANSFNLSNKISYSDIINRKIKVLTNDEYYYQEKNQFKPNTNLKEMYYNSSLTLTIVGVVKELEPLDDNSYLLYHQDITNYLLTKNATSQIVNYQLQSNSNILNSHLTKEDLLSYLGYQTLPYKIDIYFANLKSKEIYTKYLNKYSLSKLIYEDHMKDTLALVKKFINIISFILIIFSIIAIIVSSIMISILTNTRIMERIKEIGILRSLGATNKNVKLLFNLENFFIAIFSSLISLIISISLSNPINSLINKYLNVTNMYKFNYIPFLIITFINLIIVILSGYGPVRKASKLDVVSCLHHI